VPAAEAGGPLADEELDGLFAPLAGAAVIALAVSGGADSLALAASVARWRGRRRGRPDAIVLTVDHRLRAGSGREAANVAEIAGRLGLAARVLVWSGPRPRANLEATARQARYRLLLTAAGEAGASHLALAHHRDDQAETFLLRLQRGAGVFGLAAMRPMVAAGAITIARPFLSVSRSRLVATTAAAGLEPVEDPMNTDPRFARARVRRIMPLLAADGFDAARIAATAARLAGAAAAIDAAASALIATAVETDGCAVARVEPAAFGAAAEEVRLRALARMLVAIGGEDYPPRHVRLRRLLDAIAGHGGGRFKRTLAGTVIEWRAGRFLLYREWGREAPPTVTVKAGHEGTWDHRFRVAVGAGAPAGLWVGPLGEEGRRLVGAYAGQWPAAALATLPAVRRRGKLVAVPTLGYAGPGGEGLPVAVSPVLGERLSVPPLFPDFDTDA